MIKNIIFDWSGVISNDLEPVFKATLDVFRAYDIPVIRLEEFKREFVLPYMDFYKKYSNDIVKEKSDALFRKMIKKYEKPKPYPHVKETLARLYHSNIIMIVLSAHIQENIVAESCEYGLSGFLQEINGSVYNKILNIKAIMERNRFNPAETMYVGDMKHDIEAGKEAGVATVALTWGYQSEAVLRKASPDYIIHDIRELGDLL